MHLCSPPFPTKAGRLRGWALSVLVAFTSNCIHMGPCGCQMLWAAMMWACLLLLLVIKLAVMHQ